MTGRFPNTPTFSGFNEPCRVEADIFDLEVEGAIPAALSGVLYRVGPDPRFPPKLGDDINLNGDGMVTMWRFAGGHVDFKSRYVRTEKFELEAKARRALFGAYRNPFTDDPAVAGKDRTTANTSMIFHGGKLFAIKEDGLPYEIDPWSLETRGRYDYSGCMRSQTATAHPKIDPRTGEMYSMGYEARGLATRDISLQVMDSGGTLVREDFFAAPYVSFMHDWGVTTDHLVFPVIPVTTDIERMRAGQVRWAFDPGLATEFGIMPRDAGTDALRWFKGAGCSIGHVLNAFSDGDKVYLDAAASDRCHFPFVANKDGLPFDRKLSTVQLRRWSFDLSKNNGGQEMETMFEDFADMPVTDDRFQTTPYRYGFVTIVDGSKPINVQGTIGLGWNTVAKVDLATRRMDRFYVGERTTCQEARFIPRSASAPEADGYLLTVLTRFDDHIRTELVVLDTARLVDGPIATIRMPYRLHGQIHGTWVPAEALPTP